MSYKIILAGSLVLLAIGLSIVVVEAQRPPPGGRRAPAALAGTGFTYQGQLKQNGALVNGSCDFQFGLWDDPTSGPQYGATQTVSSLPVTNGLFTTQIDFGGVALTNYFTGTARYLQVAVNCGGGLTTLSPRQPLTPAPYALALPGLYTQQDPTSPNVIGGHISNTVSGGVHGATIGGGGQSGFPNRVSAIYGTIGGGWNNTSSNIATTVGGGTSNTANGIGAFIGGGGTDGTNFPGNVASGIASTIGGGISNTISAIGTYATIGGGISNTVSNNTATIGGGYGNTASANSATIGGGSTNTASGTSATIGGGVGNIASGYRVTIGGGSFNVISPTAPYATIGGGLSNTVNGDFATIGGGDVNTASGSDATIPGGANNIASGNFSFAAGRYANTNNQQGAFVWGDTSTTTYISATFPNQFLVRASGGISIYTNSLLTTGCNIPAGGGAWSCTSDRNTKTNFASTDGRDILARLAIIPIQTWNYKTQDSSIRHIGPMAQDFYAAFEVGEDDNHISTVDADGVAFAAIQGLYEVVQEKDAEISGLKSQVASQRGEIDDLKTRLALLEQAQPSPHPLPIREREIGLALLIGAMGVIAFERVRKGGAR